MMPASQLAAFSTSDSVQKHAAPHVKGALPSRMRQHCSSAARVLRHSKLQQAQALVDVVGGEQPKLVEAGEVHGEDAAQLHAAQDVVPVVEGEGFACCRHLHGHSEHYHAEQPVMHDIIQ